MQKLGLVLFVLVAGMVALFMSQLPDIQRYLKMRSM
jgi:hypothetical protein